VNVNKRPEPVEQEPAGPRTKYRVVYTAIVWATCEEEAAMNMLTDAEDWDTEVEEAADDE
jgi:hypothetical protein